MRSSIAHEWDSTPIPSSIHLVHLKQSNLPLWLGIPALSLGAGCERGGDSTLIEQYSPRNRETGLKRISLLILAMTDWPQSSKTEHECGTSLLEISRLPDTNPSTRGIIFVRGHDYGK
jgi:hypothetical protein